MIAASVALGRSTRRHLRILWIDDEPLVVRPCSRFLEIHGMKVDWAATGLAGVRKAKEDAYDVIVLDLKLPDISGVDILRQLRGAGVVTPAVIITGYPSFESAVEALRLGAIDYRQKPFVGRPLLAMLECAAARRPNPGDRPIIPETSSPASSSEHDTRTARALFDLILEVSAPGPSELPFADRRDRLLDRLVEIIVTPHVGLPMFLACAAGFRIARRACEPHWPQTAERLSELIDCALPSTRKRWHETTVLALDHLTKADVQQRRPSEEQLADTLSISPSRLSHLIREDIGYGYRLCRVGVVMRRAAGELATSDEQVAQIASRHGYEHANQFARDFRRLFGESPGQFRSFANRLMSCGV